jgi:hypothetical protein
MLVRSLVPVPYPERLPSSEIKAMTPFGSYLPPFHPYARIGEDSSQPPLDDKMTEQVANVWKAMFPDAAVLPVVGYPSHGKGVMTIIHSGNVGGMPQMPLMTINGVSSSSPLANSALYSAELTPHGYLNLYETMLPDVPGRDGNPSLGSRYKNALQMLGIEVDGDHFHWAGGEMMGHFARAIHSKNFGMHPLDFSQRQLRAFMTAFGAG